MNLQQQKSDLRKALITTYPLYPIFDIEESDSHYVLCLDGRVFFGTEIDIELVNDEIVIKGVGDASYDDGRSPKDVVVKSNGVPISTQYKDGLLMVALPKNSVKLHH